MSYEIIKKLISGSILLLSLFSTFYLLLFVNEEGFEFIWVLPLTFGLCYPFLSKAVENEQLTIFFSFFTGVSFLRYVAGPFLLSYTNDYFGLIMNVRPSIHALHVATYLMVYELIACSLIVYFFSKRQFFQSKAPSYLTLPKSYLFYMVFVFISALFVLRNPSIIYFFSFGIWGMNDLELSTLTTSAQATIMLAISAKFVLFWILLSWIKSKHDSSNFPFLWKFLGAVVTFILGFLYYGGNRAQFLFSLISSFYIFILFFPNLKRIVILLSFVFGAIVLSFMTDQRNYFDYYSYEKGTRNKILNTSQTITAYFGGLTNVAIGVDMAERFPDRRNGSQVLRDVLLPVVGLNKLITFEKKETSNTLFNYVFFNSKKVTSQILPSIAHGYFFFGPIFCVLMDVLQFIFIFFLIIILKKTRRMELVFIFNVVLFRFSLMFGQNITQQINGIAMQLVLPMCVYWLNNQISLTRKE